MPRRTVEAILVAHEMDRARRELYVEGRHDEDFLVWLSADDLDHNSLIHPIGLVEIPDQLQGGNRERVLVLARLVVGRGVTIRCLIDADGSHLEDQADIPTNTWTTDKCDLEWYVLREDCVGKALALGVRHRDATPRDLLAASVAVALDVAAVRAASRSRDLRLPVSETPLHKYLRIDGAARVEFELSDFVGRLLQSAKVSLKRFDEVMEVVAQERDRLNQVDPELVIRGKDVVPVLAEVFTTLCGLHRDHGHRLLWTSFEKQYVADYIVLSEVLDFLANRRSFAT